jgi:hypothetical protein
MRKNWLVILLLTLLLAGCGAFSFGQPAAPTEGAKGLETRPPALDRVQSRLADALAVDLEAVTLQEYREVEWPDACLGQPGPDEVCAQTITPGYLMLFSTPNGTVEVHTNRAGDDFRYGPALSQTGDRPLVATWQRSGGFAGICQRLMLYADGGYLLQDCAKNKALSQGQLSADVLAQLKDWSGRYQSFAWKADLPPGAADMFNDELSFTGQGTQAATAQQQEDIFNALAETVAELARKTGE